MRNRLRSGPDPDFPYLTEQMRFSFPPPERSPESIVAVGGNLSPGMLLSAYEQGIFPWFNSGDPIIWQSPNPRFVIFPEKLHVSRSMRKVLRQKQFEVTLDRDFPGVISGCAKIYRPGQCEQGPAGTWITPDIIEAYTELHNLGWAHSAESYRDGKLAGGCYGLRLGRVFFGESMFAREPNASKAAFLTLAALLFADGVAFIDCQIPSDHLRCLGGEEMERKDFLALLKETLKERTLPPAEPDVLDRRGNWGAYNYFS
ncbi:MAG: leucyl/phenylalanyl-tRNA--protein transferase [Treponema sp.]|jgi:leucyl/phenylalanyl-tRNA--protein transferase|nr:leucyl/phenylalanyl-tRNA--protein transferase [Treponema sp.]